MSLKRCVGFSAKRRRGIEEEGTYGIMSKVTRHLFPFSAIGFANISSFVCLPKTCRGFPWWLSGKNLPANAGDMGSIPGWGRSPGEGNGYPLQYSCLGNPMDGRSLGYSPWGCRRVGHNLVTEEQGQGLWSN